MSHLKWPVICRIVTDTLKSPSNQSVVAHEAVLHQMQMKAQKFGLGADCDVLLFGHDPHLLDLLPQFDVVLQCGLKLRSFAVPQTLSGVTVQILGPPSPGDGPWLLQPCCTRPGSGRKPHFLLDLHLSQDPDLVLGVGLRRFLHDIRLVRLWTIRLHPRLKKLE